MAVVGAAGRGPQADAAATRLVWLIRLEDGQMAQNVDVSRHEQVIKIKLSTSLDKLLRVLTP